MGEATCLRRSFSNPSQISHEFSEGDPTRALGESISFGRYMSETLDWEKWSAFSQNRYLEEAEKTSKPGSVAKMKAYFEAHYKKIGAKKQAALEQANDACSYVETKVQDGHNMELVSSSSSPAPNQITTLPDSQLTADELPKLEISNVEPLSSVLISSCDSSNQSKEAQKEEVSIVESISDSDFEENLPVVQEQQTEDTEVNASITESCVEIKVNQSFDAMKDNIISTTPEKQVIVEKEAKEEKLDPKSKQESETSSLRSTKKSNMSKLSSSLARLATPGRPKKEGGVTVTNNNSAMELVEKKKSTSKLVQMSVNLNSDVKPVKKGSPTSHKTGIGKVFTPLTKMIRQSINYTPIRSTSRASVNSVSRHPSATPLSETRRSRIALEKSFTRPGTSDQKLQSTFVGNMKPRAPSSITFSPFSFRTEERAAKRKEFFERKLEKEAENLKLLDKAKIHPARAHPPKYESKHSTNLARGKSSQPPPRPGSASNKSIPATLPTKKRHENTSPNIL